LTKPKLVGKCCNMIFNFCKYNDYFLQKKRSNIPLSYLFFTFVQNFKSKKENLSWHGYLNVFKHILKELHEFLSMMGAIIMFGKRSFISNFVGYGLVTVTWGRVHIWGGVRENKMSKDECELFTTKLRWIISPTWISRGQNPLSYYTLWWFSMPTD
jgi:hypothetical protein